MQRKLAGLCVAIAIAATGCSQEARPTSFENPKGEKGHGHSHEHNKMMLEDFGPYHVGLTAHLSQKEGNELDVVFETLDEKPVPIASEKLEGNATRRGEDRVYTLEFEPAPKNERPNDPEGKCSRYTARAAWMKRDDVLTVTIKAPLEGKERKAAWVDFNPQKFAHADE